MLSDKEVAAFKAWLTKRGAIVDPPTNVWEVLRVRTCFGLFVVYTNKAGRQTWPDELVDILNSYKAKQDVALSPDLKSKVKLRHLIDDLGARDGLWCWFCEIGFLSPDSAAITIEHLVPKAHGGPNHPSNLVLACRDCNGEAGSKSVSEKVAMRDRNRGFVCEQAETRHASV